ncbi:MAG TPA: helix-turn-helix domain-containing protein [Candidatus Saccharimonadales bacterium]
MKETLYTVGQLATIFNRTRQTMHNWISDGRFPNMIEAGEGGGRVFLVPASDVERVKEEEATKLIQELNRLGFQAVSA